MIDSDVLKKLKQVNASKDAEKTKTRFSALFKALSVADKNRVQEYAGVARNTLYRVYDIGSITPKIALAASQVMNVSPQYLTGESDEKGESTDDISKKFLKNLGYKDMFADEVKKKTRKPRKKAAKADTNNQDAETDELLEEIAEAVVEAAVEDAVAETIANSEDRIPLFDEFGADEISTLLNSIQIRARNGNDAAYKQAVELRNILLR